MLSQVAYSLLPFLVLQLFHTTQARAAAFPTLSGKRPIVIAHRGASGYRPEHTLASYRLAMELGADFVEPDLVATRDGYLVARHEPNMIDTTDVANRPEFKDRLCTKKVDGVEQVGYFTDDFTLAEIKTLRAVQSRPFRDPSYNGLFEIPTFDEIIAAVQTYEKETGRKVGVYPETKHPTYFRERGLPLEEELVQTLRRHQFTDPKRIFIQSFEVGNLRDILRPLLDREGLAIPLIQLMDEPKKRPYDYDAKGSTLTYADLMTAHGLTTFVATYAQGIGPYKTSIFPRLSIEPVDLNGDGKAEATEKLSGETTSLIADAHRAGLQVHPYTLRNEEIFQASPYKTPSDEYESFMRAGVDGFFSDFPDTARLSVESYEKAE